jgi:hypothetical protein
MKKYMAILFFGISATAFTDDSPVFATEFRDEFVEHSTETAGESEFFVMDPTAIPADFGVPGFGWGNTPDAAKLAAIRDADNSCIAQGGTPVIPQIPNCGGAQPVTQPNGWAVKCVIRCWIP